MGAPKGHPKYPGAGRKKGTPNKTTEALFAKCEAKGIDPWDLLLEFCGPAEPNLRFAALKEICQYLYPKRKALEHSGEINNPFLEKSEKELERLVKEKLNK